MNRSLHNLAARKQVLLAQVQLQRMELALHVDAARDALRPVASVGGAMARPAALVALASTIAGLLGWRRLARGVRIGAIAIAVLRVARAWRAATN